MLTYTENTSVPATFEALANGACSAENEALPITTDNVPQANLDQKLQLLASQDDLPVVFPAGNVELDKDLADGGYLTDLGPVFEDLDATADIQPAAVATIKALYGDFLVLPTQYNIEGIWYNKAIFDKYGLEVPTTWDEFLTVAKTLSDNGVQPLTASGEAGWPLTRLISSYLFRSVGDDAMEKVISGEKKLTDPEYVAAAQAVADLGAAGYFGPGVGSVDYDSATNSFLNGTAGMVYMGSWILSNLNSDSNKIGNDNVGFFPFPDVPGGKGASGAPASNVGLPFAFNAKYLDNKDVKNWVKCIAENYGSVALSEQNVISGFTVNEPVEVDALTQGVQDTIANTSDTTLWFEALMDPKATATAQTNAAQLVTGAITAEQFMETVQNDITVK
ncbi:ABC transporter substrate-binding protein [Agromyces albus]|uniref:ABC transporter substrate-binding protein n=1 Tax=Agromyces albus TaxID=205332 RepID=UPI0027D91BFB|nr:extracellular solute-binding protein [Agromyces albus]